MGRNVHETDEHRTAFEIWVALGDRRTISEVARRTNRNEASVYKWSHAFGWQKRLVHRQKLVAAILTDRGVEDEAKSRADGIKIARAIQLRYASKLADKSADATLTANDFATAVKTELLLRGRATERIDMMDSPAFQQILDMIAQVIEREVKDSDLRGRLALGFQEAAAQLEAHA